MSFLDLSKDHDMSPCEGDGDDCLNERDGCFMLIASISLILAIAIVVAVAMYRGYIP